MRYFEDFYLGEVIELGSYTITQDQIIEFAKQFDPQPFHIDPERAKDSLFEGLAASGWHTGSIYMRLLYDGLLSKSASMGSPGLDEVRWTKPVRPGDTLTAQYKVIETTASRSRPNMGIIKTESQMVNQNGEVVMTMRGAGFFGRKP